MEKLKNFLKSKNIKNLDSKIKKESEEERIGLQNKRMNRILDKADEELRFLKLKNPPIRKCRLDGKYESKKRKVKEYAFYTADDFVVGEEEWHKAYENFCKKTENIYGVKVDRSHLVMYNKEQCRSASSSDDSSKADV